MKCDVGLMIDHDAAEKQKESKVGLVGVTSACDQCVWEVGVVAGYSHWVGH